MITYVKGDATVPISFGLKGNVIAHVVNDVPAWGAGFVLAVSKRWPHVEACYRQWAKTKTLNTLRVAGLVEATGPFRLGHVLSMEVTPDLWVACLLAQHGLRGRGKSIPLQYNALETSLQRLGAFASRRDLAIHMPRIGCGLAGGTWSKVEPLILDSLVRQNLAVTVYDLP